MEAGQRPARAPGHFGGHGGLEAQAVRGESITGAEAVTVGESDRTGGACLEPQGGWLVAAAQRRRLLPEGNENQRRLLHRRQVVHRAPGLEYLPVVIRGIAD